MFKVRVCVETSREYGRGLLRGIYRYSNLHRSWQIDLDGDGAEGLPGDADGAILRDHRRVPLLLRKGIPIVFASYLHKNIRGGHRILSDDRAIGRMAATHLLERGFRRFAFIGYDGMYWSRQRQESFSQAIGETGRACEVFKQAGDLRLRVWRRERKVLAEWLKTLERPVGVLACNDDRAREVVETCAIAGLAVPEEVAVLGVDDDEFVCNLANPPISSVSLGVEEAGYRAAEMLDEMMRAKNARTAISEARLPSQILVSPLAVVTRQSTDVAVIEDPFVAAAVQFIRVNCRRSIRMADVVRQAAVSRRNLSDRFRRTFGCTIAQYIKRIRIARIEELLRDDSCSVGEIAEVLGFASQDHLAQYFRSVTGMTPNAFRTQCRRR
jgi:LacI family transcriptional regulator